jgi:hypothetical protein
MSLNSDKQQSIMYQHIKSIKPKGSCINTHVLLIASPRVRAIPWELQRFYLHFQQKCRCCYLLPFITNIREHFLFFMKQLFKSNVYDIEPNMNEKQFRLITPSNRKFHFPHFPFCLPNIYSFCDCRGFSFTVVSPV